MKSLEELLWKEGGFQKEEVGGSEAQAMKQVCIAICCAYAPIGSRCKMPPCAAGTQCR